MNIRDNLDALSTKIERIANDVNLVISMLHQSGMVPITTSSSSSKQRVKRSRSRSRSRSPPPITNYRRSRSPVYRKKKSRSRSPIISKRVSNSRSLSPISRDNAGECRAYQINKSRAVFIKLFQDRPNKGSLKYLTTKYLKEALSNYGDIIKVHINKYIAMVEFGTESQKDLCLLNSDKISEESFIRVEIIQDKDKKNKNDNN